MYWIAIKLLLAGLLMVWLIVSLLFLIGIWNALRRERVARERQLSEARDELTRIRKGRE